MDARDDDRALERRLHALGFAREKLTEAFYALKACCGESRAAEDALETISEINSALKREYRLLALGLVRRPTERKHVPLPVDPDDFPLY